MVHGRVGSDELVVDLECTALWNNAPSGMVHMGQKHLDNFIALNHE